MSGRPHRPPRPGRASHPSRKSPGFSTLLRRLPAHGRTNARARTFAHVHTQQKEAVRTACRGLVGALRKPLPPAPAARPGACSLTGAPRELLVGAPIPAAGSPPARLCSAALAGRAGGAGGCAADVGPQLAEAPRHCSARRPAERRQNRTRAAVGSGLSSKSPRNMRAPYFPVSLRNKTIILNYPQ